MKRLIDYLQRGIMICEDQIRHEDEYKEEELLLIISRRNTFKEILDLIQRGVSDEL